MTLMSNYSEKNTEKHLTLNGKVFLFSEIMTQPLSHFTLATVFEKTTIGFCKAWLSNQKTYAIHTSGSTGTPKTIKISRSQMITSAEMTAIFFALAARNRILINLNTQYIAGMMMVVRGFHLDLQMTIIEPSFNPYESIDESFDFYAFVPLQLQAIIEGGKSHFLHDAKAIIVGGAPVSDYQEKLFSNITAPVYATYGMTETCTHVALRKLGENSFKALQGVSFDITKNGCLIIHSPTAIASPLITTDVVELISDHEFKWKGRLHNIINSGGIKIQVEELERKIAVIVPHTRFVILAMPDDKLGEKVILVSDKKIDTTLLKKKLSAYECPKEYHVVPSFPETPTGKIDRIKLADLLK